MWPTWWWPGAGVDAAADLDLQLADRLGAVRVGEVLGDVLGDRDRAGVGQRAVVQPRAGDDVADQVDVRRRQARRASAAQTAGRSSSFTCGSTRFCSWVTRMSSRRVALGQVGDDLHLLGRGVARGLADRLQRDVDDGVARRLVGLHVVARRSGRRRASALAASKRLRLAGRVSKRGGAKAPRMRASSVSGRSTPVRRSCAHSASTWRANSSAPRRGDQDLDPRLVDVVAPAVAVVDAQDRLQVREQVARRQELADRRRR